jgi:hypothetical protein
LPVLAQIHRSSSKLLHTNISPFNKHSSTRWTH